MINESNIVQSQSQTVEYWVAETSTWTSTEGVEFGVSTEITAGVPTVSSTKVSNIYK